MPPIDLKQALASLPPVWPQDLRPTIRQRVLSSGGKLVVLDDDPTGSQTVHDVPVWTDWSVDSLARAFREPFPLFFILTNSRSLPPEQAEALNRQIACNLRLAADRTHSGFNLISRSDSTLRGHYPGEVDWLLDALRVSCDGVILAPFFVEGGRYTLGDVHYVAEGDRLVPANETEFASDPAFGYQHANLRDWVVEKHQGRIQRTQVASIGLDTLRQGGPDVVRDQLMKLESAQPCVVNAVDYRDLDVFVMGLLEAEARGKRFIYRTAASFVRARVGMAEASLLGANDLLPEDTGGRGGLVVAGSYVDRTTRQLAAVEAAGLARPVVVGVPRLIESQAAREREVRRVIRQAEKLLAAGEHALVYTSREKVDPGSGAGFLALGQIISQSLVAIIRGIETPPAWLVAKGGITSSVIATDGLAVRRALVLGQALPGVPVWRLGAESRMPGRSYVIFPGNVGGEDALARVVAELGGEKGGACL